MKFCYCFCFTFFLIFSAFIHEPSAQDRSYFPGKIIIKYKTDNRLRAIQSQTKADPERAVQSALQQAGATSVQPVWDKDRTFLPGRAASAQIKNAAQDLERIYEVSYSSSTDPAVLASKMSQYAGIEYAEPKYIRQMQFTPNDPITNPYQDVHRFEEAWDITRGSSDVIIAIVDGGVNYVHTELDDKMWINTDEVAPAVRGQVDQDSDGEITSTEVKQYLADQDEDYDGNGRINLQDALADNSPLLTGNDTDGNGLADDIFGWDYWAAGGVNGQPITPDNNPMADGTDHGVHVTGIATAETNNEEGIAGTGFDVRYMALKAGGIPDEPSTPNDESRAIGFGYESIIYAALEGADVINCSWGGGGFSEFENDVINFATDMGALVIAASGNAAASDVDFPAGYANSLSVGSIGETEQVSNFSNIGFNLDVFATGESIKSTGFRNAIVTNSGTSMSTPATAGLAGLLKSLHPEWGPLRIAAQIRSSARFIDSGNNRQGHGIIDAFRAVSTDLPSVRVVSSEFEDSDGNKLGLGESGAIKLQIINYGNTASNLSLQIESLVGQGITLNQTDQAIGTLASGESTEVEFSVRIGENYDLNIAPVFRISISASSDYRDFDVIRYDDILFDVVDANNIRTSFAGDGTIGFVDAFAGRGGVGFIPRTQEDTDFTEAENVLFEGGLILEANDIIFDVVRGPDSQIEKDFEPVQTFGVTKEGTTSTQDGNTVFAFADEAGTAAGRVRLQTFAFDDPDLDNVVYLKYSVTNASTALPLEEVYVGLFNDWDIGRNITTNNIEYSARDSILYVSDGGESPNEPIVAVAHLGEISSVLALNNFPETTPTSPPVDLNDGFDDTEKKQALRAGTDQTTVSGADVSAVTASGPYTLNPEATLTAGFIYAFGNDVDELRAQIQSARQQAPFRVSKTGIVISDRIPDATDLFQNAPNPFTDQTTIQVNLSEAADVKLAVYDVLGREVDLLRDERLEANEYFIPFNPVNLSSGIYFVRLQAGNTTETITITYIR